MSDPVTPEDYERLAAEAEAEANAIDLALQAERLEAQTAKTEIDRLEEELRLKTAALKERISTIQSNMWDRQREIRRKQNEAESYRRQKEQAERAALAAQEWSTLEDRWDRLTMGAPWREWAKDHQLTGAKKITYEGRMILGDTMGLGKTLTSLIAIDMIQAATKDASPEHPVTFGSMK